MEGDDVDPLTIYICKPVAMLRRGNGDIRVGNACPKTCLEFAMRAPRELPEGLRVHEELPETLPIQGGGLRT
eukprot:1393374-Amorphochlora_amoeboformis.AAC.1